MAAEDTAVLLVVCLILTVPVKAHPSSAEAVVTSSSAAAIPPAIAVQLERLLPDAANGTTSRVAVLQGETALLPCKAYSLGQRTVSWIRRRDWHILSSGTNIYTADERFQVLHRPGSPDWFLKLKSPQPHDSGTYECQISDGKGQISHFSELLVWSPAAVIAEGSEHHVEASSSIRLHCSLTPEGFDNSTEKLQVFLPFAELPMPVVTGGGAPVVWFHNGRPLEKSARGAAEPDVRLIGNTTKWTTWSSRLNIAKANMADSGNYTCSPWRGKPATVAVFVTTGDHPAAVQRQGTLVSSAPLQLLIAGLNLLLIYPYLMR